MKAKKPAAKKKTSQTPAYRPDKKTKSAPAAGAAGYRPDKKTKSMGLRKTAAEIMNEPALVFFDVKEQNSHERDFRKRLKQAQEREAAKMTSDQDRDQETIDALRNRVLVLEAELEILQAKHDALLADLEGEGEPGEKVQPITGSRYVRGKLPGDKLIRIDTLTNGFEEISLEEWNALGAAR